jgi:hypothetical protein
MNYAKEKWKIAYMCGLSKIKCPNQERSISITFLGFSGWTLNVFIYGWL